MSSRKLTQWLSGAESTRDVLQPHDPAGFGRSVQSSNRGLVS